MSAPPLAQITSYELIRPDLAVLTYTVNGAVCRIGFTLTQVDNFHRLNARIRPAMMAAAQGESK